jgi:hypothetical protein
MIPRKIFIRTENEFDIKTLKRLMI